MASAEDVRRERAASVIARALKTTEEETQCVAGMLAAAERPAAEFWQPGVCEQVMIPVSDAEIRVFHAAAPNASAVRPIVMIPGFGATPEGFQDFYAAVQGRAELFHLETREKPSSRILNRRADMSVSRSARDIQSALEYLGLARRDFVLVALCWGAASVLQGLIEGCLEAPTIVLADPMHALWFPKWVLRYVSPVLPSPTLLALRPFLVRSMLGDMREPTQRQRAVAFAYSADPWKWKKSAEAAWDFELYGRLSSVRREVFVLNGTRDKIHDQRHYPRVAQELPAGRFLYMPTDERCRERLFGVAALEMARVRARDGLPATLARFEKPVR